MPFFLDLWFHFMIIFCPVNPELATTTTSLLQIVPHVLMTMQDKGQLLDIADAVELHADDLPSPETVDQELFRWRDKWGKLWENDEEIPKSCAQAITKCDPIRFPNLYVLLQLVCTSTVTSCECERAASVLRRLHNFMRSSMTEERLTGLALIHVNYDFTVSLDDAVNLFAKMHPRRVKLQHMFLNQ